MSAVNRIAEYLFIVNSSENQPRRSEEHEGFFLFFLRFLRIFVVDFCHLGVRVPLKFESCPIAFIAPRIELPSIEPFPVTATS
jgi:hypothetical protein